MEKRALGMLLEGDDDRLVVLRRQFDGSTVARREFSGTGFFTHFSVPADLPRLERATRLVIGDVYAEVTGLEHPAGFLLFVNDGAIDMLECFSFDDAWPKEAEIRRAYYVRPASPGSPSLVETRERDLSSAFEGAV